MVTGSEVLLAGTSLQLHFTSAVETVKAVDDVSIELPVGELACLYGASGSGKSSLLHVLAGITLPSSGSVILGDQLISTGTDAERARVRLDSIGVVFQTSNLVEEFTALENVALPLEARGVRRTVAAMEAREALELVNMASLGHRLPSELSGGQRQRVGIARALVGGRRVLLADEPTGSLDSGNSERIFDLLSKLAAQGYAILVASHDPQSRAVAHAAYMMVDGKISLDG